MKILIADDESIIRLGLKAMLQEMGHDVLMAADGRDALELARRHAPDLAILDIKMPQTNGLQAAQTLSRTQPMPILLLTAYSQQDLIDQASELPIHSYLTKPVKVADLRAAITIACKRFDDAQTLRQRTTKLEQTLENRKLIDRAKGKLMSEQGLSEDEAYQWLQAQARQSRQSMKIVAQSVLENKKL